jgi:hypothetical protein
MPVVTIACVPGAAQHAVVRCGPGTVTDAGTLGGPASAVQRCTLHRVRDTRSRN